MILAGALSESHQGESLQLLPGRNEWTSNLIPLTWHVCTVAGNSHGDFFLFVSQNTQHFNCVYETFDSLTNCSYFRLESAASLAKINLCDEFDI